MIFDERNRDVKILIEAKRARRLSYEESLNIFFDMNKTMLKICTESVIAENPNISKKNLLNEVKRIYSFGK